MSNVPILLIGGTVLSIGVYFLTKRKSPVEVAKQQRDEAIRKGGPSLLPINLPDPPLQGARVAEGFSIEKRGDWSRENPKFNLTSAGVSFTDFDYRRQFKAPANHVLWGNDVCPGGCVLYQPGPNSNAGYPSEFVETSKGIAAILGTVGQGITGAFQAKSQFDIQKMQLKAGGGGFMPSQPQVIVQPQSNTTLIFIILLGGLAMTGMMFFMMKDNNEK